MSDDRDGAAEVVTDAAEEVTDHAWVEAAARAGFVANGVVNLLIGVIIIAIAQGTSNADAGDSGALRAIAAAPLGGLVLWAIAVALAALALWRVAEAILLRGRDLTSWGRRVVYLGQAVAYVGIGALAILVATGLDEMASGSDTAADATRTALRIPGGAWAVGIVGAGIAIGGIVMGVYGARRSYRKRLSRPDGAWGAVLDALAITGYIGKGLSLIAIGTLLIVAAVKLDPSAAGGLDEAIGGLLGLSYGPALVVAIGVGFITYGLYNGLRAKYATL